MAVTHQCLGRETDTRLSDASVRDLAASQLETRCPTTWLLACPNASGAILFNEGIRPPAAGGRALSGARTLRAWGICGEVGSQPLHEELQTLLVSSYGRDWNLWGIGRKHMSSSLDNSVRCCYLFSPGEGAEGSMLVWNER